MKRIIIALLLFCGTAYAQNTAPMSNQISWGALVYGGSQAWSTTGGYARQKWLANHMHRLIGAPANGATFDDILDTLYAYNPLIKVYPYNIFMRYAIDTTYAVTLENDSAQIRNYIGSDTAFKNMVYHMGSGAGDTAWCNFFFGGTSPLRRSGPGKILRAPYFSQGAVRLYFDYRHPKVGTYWYYAWCQDFAPAILAKPAFGGFFVDEEGIGRRTGMIRAGLTSPHMPGLDSAIAPGWSDNVWGNYDLTSGWGFRHIHNPWSTSLTFTQIADSNSVLRNQQAARARDTAALYGHELIMNPAGVIGPLYYNPGFNTNWDLEGNGTASAWGGSMLAEYGTTFPTEVNYHEWCNALRRALFNARDSNYIKFIWGPRFFACDVSVNRTADRLRMLNLGFVLLCTYPGIALERTTWAIVPACYSNGTYFEIANRDDAAWNCIPGCGDYPDSVACMAPAYGKYFGTPQITRDSTSGTDGASQAYILYKTAFTHPSDANDTLSFSAFRYTRGTNYTATSAVNFSLPSGSWYELNVDGTWTGPLSGTLTLRNSEARVFSSDTTLSNDGLEADTVITVPSSKTQNEGDAGTSTFNVRVSLNIARLVNTTFFVTTAGVSATAGTDYTQINGAEYTILAGNLYVDVPVSVIGDGDVESNETFMFTISNPSSPITTGSNAVCTVTITNDDLVAVSPGAVNIRDNVKASGKVIIQGAP